MRTMIRTISGKLVNLHNVATARTDERGVSVLYGTGGERIGETYADLEEEIYRVVPAQPGQRAWLVTCWEDTEPRADLRDIVAWRVDSAGSTPILAGDAPSSNQTVLIIHPNEIEYPGSGTFSHLASAISDVREGYEISRKRAKAKREAA